MVIFLGEEVQRGCGEMKKLKYSNIFCLFVFGSLLGFVLEGIWHTLRKGYWENRTGTVWGPFCVIYGFGAVVLYLLGCFIKTENIVIIFILSAIAGSLAELIAGLFQEAAFGTYSWNYSGHAFNIKGKISLEMSIMWGVLGTLFIKFAVPRFNSIFENMHGRMWNSVVAVFSAFLLIDLAVTGAALVRWKKRSEGICATNRVERFIDRHWDDDKMQKIFPNMKRV